MSIVGKTIVAETPLVSVYPAEVDSTDTGAAVDCSDYGSQFAAIQIIGGAGGTGATLDGKIQESPDGGSWHDVPDAAFAQVTASNNRQAILLTRSMRFLRHVRVVDGTSPTFVLSAMLIPLGNPVGRTVIVQPGPGVRVDVR